VDHRRKNRSLETLQTNAARLKAYKASLVVFPRRSKKPKAGDATAEELQKADQCTTTLAPITKPAVAPEFVALTADMKATKAYGKLRVERMNKRQMGMRKKRAEEEAAAAKDKAKLGA
jgi:large subunit ribosomal protein L13e